MHAQEGLFHMRSRWRDVFGHVSSSDEYRAALAQSGSTPAEMYEDFIETHADTYHAQRKTLKTIVGALAGIFNVEEKTTYEQFVTALRSFDAGTVDGLSSSAMRAYFDELIAPLRPDADDDERHGHKRKKHKKEKRAKRARDEEAGGADGEKRARPDDE